MVNDASFSTVARVATCDVKGANDLAKDESPMTVSVDDSIIEPIFDIINPLFNCNTPI